MKIALLLTSVLLSVCNAQAGIIVLSSNPDVKVKKELIEVGKRCVEWDYSGHEPLCVKEEPTYAEVATVTFGEEEEDVKKSN